MIAVSDLVLLLLFVSGIAGLCWAADLVGQWIGSASDPIEPHPPVPEPTRHVTPTRLEPGGCVKKIGVHVHAKACVDDEGKCECVCGLDDIAEDWLASDPDMGGRDAELLAWAELHGEVSS